jgi:hypothetical protein
MRAAWLALLLAACSGTVAPLDAGNGGDMATAADGGLLPFGAACTMDSQCATGHCYIGTVNFCTMPCTPATASTDCPSPPTSGICNMKGYCRP